VPIFIFETILDQEASPEIKVALKRGEVNGLEV
jgi:hypothetical protein